WTGTIALAGVAWAFVRAVGQWGLEQRGYADMVVLDDLATLFNLLFLASTFVTILLSEPFLRSETVEQPEYYALLLFCPAGLLLAGMAMILIGFAFKVALVPFHMWTPDVYEGAPTPITAFMSAGPKAAAFAAFLRTFFVAFGPIHGDWNMLLSVIAALTMTVGNVAAIAQTNVKRMLAYSSIAHSGYVLIGLVAGGNVGGTASIFYLLAYTAMNLGAF